MLFSPLISFFSTPKANTHAHARTHTHAKRHNPLAGAPGFRTDLRSTFTNLCNTTRKPGGKTIRTNAIATHSLKGGSQVCELFRFATM